MKALINYERARAGVSRVIATDENRQIVDLFECNVSDLEIVMYSFLERLHADGYVPYVNKDIGELSITEQICFDAEITEDQFA